MPTPAIYFFCRSGKIQYSLGIKGENANKGNFFEKQNSGIEDRILEIDKSS